MALDVRHLWLIGLVGLLCLAATPRDTARELINDRRDCAVLVQTRAALVRDATRHSRAMADADALFHSELEIGRWSLVGEVIGVGSNVGQIVDALFQSRPHRRILRDCRYDKIAVGLARDERLWFTARLYAL